MNKYYLIVIGCQMNKADGERLAAYLESLGLMPAATAKEADLVALVTCGVRQTAEDRVYGLIKQLKKDRPQVKIILTGCLSDRADVRKRLGDEVAVYFNITDLPQLAGQLGLEVAAGSNQGYLSLKAKYESNYSAYVPIGNGCNNFCAYCVVPYARGRETYRPHQEILDEVRHLVARGYKEIVLIAQNVNSYRSGEIDFADLLSLADNLPGDFWLRFSTSHPKDLSDKLITTVAEGQKICRHFHVALQSGDDQILKLMNRKYTTEHFLNLSKKIRLTCPQASITTDVIVGFPGESQEQFLRTKKLMEQIGFTMAYLAQYSPRPGTAAAKLDDNVSGQDKKRREQILDKALGHGALAFNQQFVGQTIKVLVNEETPRFSLGKNEQFVTVKFPGHGLVGQFVNVKITEAKNFGLSGTVVK